jgi:hypothetical protein
MTDKEAMNVALEALEPFSTPNWAGTGVDKANEAITALKERLAQPEQEPVAWINLLKEARDNCKASIVEDGISALRKEYRIDLENRLTAAINTHPPQRKPMTDEQVEKIIKANMSFQMNLAGIRQDFEAAHGIKE